VQIIAGQLQQLNIPLTIQIEEQKVEVSDSSTTVGVDPTNNAGAVVLKGADLEALSDDPDELLSDLQALAGPSAGPNGGQIYIDGFTGGTLPPKASIREIRINQNPFSAEYDRLGYGRIEVFTKPGTDQFHGQVSLLGNTAGFNSRNPFESIPAGTQSPGYHSTQFSANVGGPLLSKKASFFFNIEQRNINDCPSSAPRSWIPLPLRLSRSAKVFPIRARAQISARVWTIRSAVTIHSQRATNTSGRMKRTTASANSTSLPWASINRTGNTSSRSATRKS